MSLYELSTLLFMSSLTLFVVYLIDKMRSLDCNINELYPELLELRKWRQELLNSAKACVARGYWFNEQYMFDAVDVCLALINEDLAQVKVIDEHIAYIQEAREINARMWL